ncbi:MAG: MFS transporter [Candidatus Marinimicrobia bacterium]|nr:MFS transporter [Candidatus Neomarinimicrobiota bacterium]|tara:strand:- start:4170 stop:5453 length:1284 start_codon:yes stop_codon:yes gene_type:complete
MFRYNRTVWSWAFYDWANSAFSTTVVAGFFPIFFGAYWADPSNVNQSTFQLGIANSIASIIIALISPILGAIADCASAKKKFLITFAFLGIVMTGGLWFIGKGEWELAVFVYIMASIGFMSGNIFYDSLLPIVADRNKLDHVSSFGYGLGYLGGGLLFLINVLMYLHPDWFGITDATTAVRISFVTVAVWWALFTIPTLLFVSEPKSKNQLSINEAIINGFKQIKSTFSHIRRMKVIGRFLIAYWLYIDGVDTIIKMAVKAASSPEYGFETSDLIAALLMVQFIAFPAAIFYNLFAQKIGTKNAVFIAIGGYALATFLGYYMSDRLHFFALAALIGLFQGGIQALSRSLYARLIPRNMEAEFFGFYNMLGKFASVIGPLLMGWITVATGSVRFGILSILILFILGAILLKRVDFDEGEKIAYNFGEN